MNNLIISLTILSLCCYALYLYRERIYVSTMYWIAFFIVSLALPNILKKNILQTGNLNSDAYIKLNVLYLIMGIVFIVFNIVGRKIKLKTIDDKNLMLSYNSLKNTNIFFCVMSVIFILIVVVLVGPKSIFIGSFKLIGTRSMFLDFMVSIVAFGINLSSQLRLYYVESRKHLIFTIINIAYALFFSLLFTFARRIIIYPLIISFCFRFIIKGEKPKLIKIFIVLFTTITVILPLMISIRTHGLGRGISNFVSVITDFNSFKEYLSMSADVSWNYSIAAKIIQNNIHISPITLLKPITIFIPRSIWSGKPLPLSLEIVRRLNLSNDPDLSVPVTIVGESFVYFSLFGTFIYGCLWGIVTSYFDKKIVRVDDIGSGDSNNFNNKKSFSIVVYITFSIQVIAGAMRGDLATTLQETEMVVVPVLSILYFFHKKNYAEYEWKALDKLYIIVSKLVAKILHNRTRKNEGKDETEKLIR